MLVIINFIYIFAKKTIDMCKQIYTIHIKVYELTDEDTKNCSSKKAENKIEKYKNHHRCNKNKKHHKKISSFKEYVDFINQMKTF